MYISKERERERDGGIVITITHDTCLFCRFVPLPSSCDPTLSHLDNKNIYVIRKQLYVYSLFSCGKCVQTIEKNSDEIKDLFIFVDALKKNDGVRSSQTSRQTPFVFTNFFREYF